MSIVYHFDLYPRGAPVNGVRVVRFTQLQEAEYRGEANGTGSGKIELRGTSTDAAFIDPAGMQYVRVVRGAAVVGGCFLENGDYAALTERSTKTLTFGGAGTLSYLARAIAAEQSYIGGTEPSAGVWHFTTEPAGAVLHRMVLEALDADRPQSPIAGVTMTFTEALDSDGNAWPGGSSFTVQVGENLMSITRRLMEAGLYVWLDPDTFELSAWMANTHGRDRTGVAWGANVVRFQSPTDGTVASASIKSDANRGIGALMKRSDLLVGANGVYEWVNDPATDIVWEGSYRVDDPTGVNLTAIGTVQLAARTDAGDTVRLRIMLDNDPTNGKYLPFEQVQLDDSVTLHSGTGTWDWNETEQKVAAITIKLRPGGDWDAWVDLGSHYTSHDRRAFEVVVPSHTHLDTAVPIDIIPPAVPTGLALSSDVVVNSDGSSFVRLLVTLTQPTDSDLYGSYVEVTSQNDGADPPVPVWDRPTTVLIGEGQTQTRIDGVQGMTQFWARARAADVQGNFSAFTSEVSSTTVKDAEAPAVPQGVTVISGFRGFGAFWVPSSAPDLQFYQMRWAPDLAGVPDTGQYTYHLTTATTVFIGQLEPDITYWFQVRAVDTSSNVATSNTDATAVDYQASPEAGWTDALSVVPSKIGQADMAVNSISAALGHISDLNADQMSAGTLLLTPTTGPTAIKVNTTGGVTVVDIHNDGSMKFLDPVNPARYLVMDSGQLKFTLDGGLTFTTALTPDGFYGDAIMLGSMPGGHNLVRNSSFELAAFVAAPTSAVFTDTTGTPGWKAANRTTAVVNTTEGTALTVTTLAF